MFCFFFCVINKFEILINLLSRFDSKNFHFHFLFLHSPVISFFRIFSFHFISFYFVGSVIAHSAVHSILFSTYESTRMIGMHGAMLCGAIDGDEVENEVEEEVEEDDDLENKIKINTESQKAENEKIDIENSPYVPKTLLTPVLVPPGYSSPLGTESSSSSSRSRSGRPSAVFQLTVEASIVMISGTVIILRAFFLK
jgi:hypothetical protein